METGEFPEGTMLPMDVFRPGSRESINQAGYFEKDFLGMEVAVKDSDRYEEGWAYLSFRDRSGGLRASASAFPEGPVLRLPRGACCDGQRLHAVLPGAAAGGSRRTLTGGRAAGFFRHPPTRPG